MRKKQFIILLVVLIVIVGLICGVKAGKSVSQKKAEEKAEAETEYVNKFDVSDVTAFTYMYDGQMLMFELEDGKWVYMGDSTMEMDTDQIEDLLTDMSDLTANAVIEDAEDVSEYGLGNPVQTFSAVFSNGSSLTYYFGSENEMVGGYYVQVTDDTDDAYNKNVYLVDSSVVTSTLSTSVESLQVSEDDSSVSE